MKDGGLPLKGKKGHFPAAYVEELPSNAGNTASQAWSEILEGIILHTVNYTM